MILLYLLPNQASRLLASGDIRLEDEGRVWARVAGFTTAQWGRAIAAAKV